MQLVNHQITGTIFSLALAKHVADGRAWKDMFTEAQEWMPYALSGSSADVPLAVIVFALLFGGMIGSSLPDVAEFFLSPRIFGQRYRTIPHRTLTHWPGLWILIAGLGYVFMDDSDSLMNAVGWLLCGASVGAVFHLLMDFFTPTGIPLLTPFGKHYSVTLYRVHSVAEWMFVFVIVTTGIFII